MKCSACSEGSLQQSYLNGLFPCQTCSHCHGNLIMLSDYLRWKDKYQEPPSEVESEGLMSDSVTFVEREETSKAMICPLTGKIMTKYRISNDHEHRIDLSPSINAIWLDKGEWGLLKANGLAGSLNLIFTNHWQEDLRSQEVSDIMSERYQMKFGDDYYMIKNFRDKLQSMEANKSEVLAYLMDEDPYSLLRTTT